MIDKVQVLEQLYLCQYCWEVNCMFVEDVQWS